MKNNLNCKRIGCSHYFSFCQCQLGIDSFLKLELPMLMFPHVELRCNLKSWHDTMKTLVVKHHI